MATFAYTEPAIYMPGSDNEPDIQPYPIAAGLGVARGNFVTLAAGTVSKPAGAVGTGIATSAILGMTIMDQTAIYGNPTVPATAAAANLDLFGTTTAGTVMQPGLEFTGVKVVLAHNGQQFEVSLVQAYALTQIGTSVGVAYDTASGFYVADTSATNATAKIIGEVDGPNKGVVGDIGKRVIIQFLTTVLVF